MTELMLMFIVNNRGVVHRITPGREACPSMRVYTGVKLPVSVLQCLVYKLPHCDGCWPTASSYRQHIEGGTG